MVGGPVATEEDAASTFRNDSQLQAAKMFALIDGTKANVTTRPRGVHVRAAYSK